MKIVTTINDFLVKWFNLGSHWQSLGVFFKISIIRFFISWFAISPIFISLIRKVPEEIVFSISEPDITIYLALPFSWIALWFASLSYVFGFAIYHWVCPTFVKKYPNFGEYQNHGHSPRWISWELHYGWLGVDDKSKLAERLIEKGYAIKSCTPWNSDDDYESPVVEARGTVWRFKFKGVSYEVCIGEALPISQQRDYFWEIFARWASSGIIYRHIIWLSVMISIALVIITVAQNIIFVLEYFGGNIE